MPESSLPGLDELRALQPGTPLPWAILDGWRRFIAPESQRHAKRGGSVFTEEDAKYAKVIAEVTEPYPEKYRMSHPHRMGEKETLANAAYIVAAANALPGLLARLARAEQTLPEVRDFYLSGPMTGYAEFNYPAFATATARLRALGKTVWNPAENFAGRTDMLYADYIREDVRQVLCARAVAVLDGWQQSRGASLEVHVARTLGLPVVDAATLEPIVGEASPGALGDATQQEPSAPQGERRTP